MFSLRRILCTTINLYFFLTGGFPVFGKRKSNIGFVYCVHSSCFKFKVTLTPRCISVWKSKNLMLDIFLCSYDVSQSVPAGPFCCAAVCLGYRWSAWYLFVQTCAQSVQEASCSKNSDDLRMGKCDHRLFSKRNKIGEQSQNKRCLLGPCLACFTVKPRLH